MSAGVPGLLLTMADVRKLPHVEMVTEFKCIEGWSEIVYWGGVRCAIFSSRSLRKGRETANLRPRSVRLPFRNTLALTRRTASIMSASRAKSHCIRRPFSPTS